jgi:signal transduction histidine kinase/DNA-binding response OmpR family regulator
LPSGASGVGFALGANKAVFLVGIPVVLILVLIAFAVIKSAAGEREEQGWVIHTYEVMDSLHTVMGDALDAETGQRGYLLTRKVSFLKPYREAQARFNRDLNRFQILTADNPDQQKRAASLRALFTQRLQVLDAGLKVSTVQDAATPGVIALLDQGKAMMDETRVVIGMGLVEERHLLDQRIQARRAAEFFEILSAVLVTIIFTIILLTAAVLVVRNNVRLALSEALRAKQARILQATLDNIRDGIVVFDDENKLAAFNEIFFRLMDFPTKLAVIGVALDAFREVDEQFSRQHLDDVPPENLAAQDVARMQRNDRELDLYKAAIPHEGFLIAATDVTGRVQAEQTIRQSQKMEAIGHLTGGMAHDFNNLLQIISANLDLLMKSDNSDSSKRAARLQAAVSAVERGGRLTAQLLAFARRQALDPQTINLGRLVHEMTDLLRRTLGERVEVESVVAGGLWNTLVDRSQVENAILNLAINSRDAMAEGGKLTIEVANAFLDDSYAHAHTEVTPGQYVMLAVSDTGGGMAPDVIARAFDPFFTTKPEGKGTGLGLSQVFGFVKQSGGHIKIYSEVGEGTTIKLYLPRSKKAQEANDSLNDMPVLGGKETILVVEDDEGVRAAVADMLQELGYTVERAENAESALAILGSDTKIDLLFTDVVMPGPINTRDMARKAQQMRPVLKILFTSGYTQNAIVHNGRLDEGVALLSKPYRRDDLARKLRSVLDGKKEQKRPAPIVQQRAGDASARTQNNTAAGPRKVLVVEDVALIRMTTVDMVSELGHAVFEAANGQDALDILNRNPGIDVLFTDLGLPGMSGGLLVQKARALRPDIAVIIASGYSTETRPSEEPPADAHYLPKPFDMSQMTRVFEAL